MEVRILSPTELYSPGIIFGMDEKSPVEAFKKPVIEGAKAVEAVEAPLAEAAKAVEEPLTEAAETIAAEAPPEKKRELRRMGGLRALDASVFLAINHLPHVQVGDDLIELVSDLGKGAGWVVVSAFSLWRGGRRGRRAGLTAVAAMLTSTGIAQGPIKEIFRRRRPFHDIVSDIVIGKRGSDHSFPSGHTAGSFAAATILSAAYPGATPALLAGAVGVGFSRIYLGHHYPSDVLAGAAIGAGIGAAYRASLKLEIF